VRACWAAEHGRTARERERESDAASAAAPNHDASRRLIAAARGNSWYVYVYVHGCLYSYTRYLYLLLAGSHPLPGFSGYVSGTPLPDSQNAPVNAMRTDDKMGTLGPLDTKEKTGSPTAHWVVHLG
jgi:hypothetical protein